MRGIHERPHLASPSCSKLNFYDFVRDESASRRGRPFVRSLLRAGKTNGGARTRDRRRTTSNIPDSVVRLDCFVIQWIPQFSQCRRDVSRGIIATRFQLPNVAIGSYKRKISISLYIYIYLFKTHFRGIVIIGNINNLIYNWAKHSLEWKRTLHIGSNFTKQCIIITHYFITKMLPRCHESRDGITITLAATNNNGVCNK